MKLKHTLLALLLTSGIVLLFSAQASAGPVLIDNFDSENGGVGVLNYVGFDNWIVSGGTVDLIGNGFYDFLPGNGLYVDMDGSSGDAGLMTSNEFTFLSGATYVLSFDLAGNRRTTTAEAVYVKVSLGTLVDKTISLTEDAPFTHYSYTFVGDGSTGPLSFEGQGGDNIGMLLDNVNLSVPDPGSSILLLGIGLVGLRAWRKRL